MATSSSFSSKPQKALSPVREVPPEQVKPCDFRALGSMDRTRLAPILTANEALAHMLTEVLNRNLRLGCEVSLQSCEQRPSSSFLGRTDGNYIVSVVLEPASDPAFLQIDPPLLLSILDLLLGGNGRAGAEDREITELEDQVVREFARILCQVLQTAWQGLTLQVRLGERHQADELQKSSFAAGQVVACIFKVLLQEAGTEGECRLLLPVSSAMTLLRGGPRNKNAQAPPDHSTISSRFAEKLLASKFELELVLSGGKAQATDLLSLSVGGIVKLNVPVHESAVLRVGNKDAFQAGPVRSGRQKGAQLMERLPDSAQEKRNLS